MQPLSSSQTVHFGLNNHPVRGGFVGAILGGLGAGLAVGVPLFALALLLSAHSGEGLSSAHGISIGEIVLLLLLGSVLLGPLCALAGAVGGAIAGATNKPTPVGIALGAVGAALVTGVIFALGVGRSGPDGSWDTGVLVLAFFFGGFAGAFGGGIGGAIGGALRKKIGAA